MCYVSSGPKKMEQMFVKILISILVLNGITAYSITNVKNVNTFIETTIPLKFRYLGSNRNNIIAYSTDNTHLDIHVSHDHGLTFTNKLDQFLIKYNDVHVPAKLHEIYVSPSGQNVVFTDIYNEALFISTNFGKDFKLKSVAFNSSLIEFFGEDGNQFVVFDENNKTLHYTINSGNNFHLLKDNVTSFEWQTEKGRNQNLFFGFKSTSIYMFNGSDQTTLEWKKYSGKGYRQFQVVENFVFVSTYENLIEIICENESSRVEFFPRFAFEGFHVAAIEEKSIKLAIVHKSETRLYIGNYRRNNIIQFVLSLRNIVSYFPGTTWNSTLHRIEKPFTDLYSVDGLTGVYVANVHHLQLYSKLDYFSISDITTVITLDNGVSWKPFDAHFYDPTDSFIDCTTLCRLKLNSKLFEAIGFHHYEGIKSSKNVLGLIIASGVGQSTSEPPNTRPYHFLSKDMGTTWQKILDGYYNVNIGNHGGIIVAVKHQGTTKELLYSLNYGGSWNAYVFYDRGITVFGLLTSDTHNSTEFHLIGYDSVCRRQMFITLDFKNILEHNCTENPKIKSKIEQRIFGKTIVLEETVGGNCLNFKRKQTISVAACADADYECDDGSFRNNLSSKVCHPHKIECKTGSFFSTVKLRKIESNSCETRNKINQQNNSCPIKGNRYILIANGDKVEKLHLTNNTVSMVVQANSSVRSIHFDVNTNCFFFSEFGSGQIIRQCHDSQTVLFTAHNGSWVKSLTYDDEHQVLYFLDGREKKILAVHTNKLNWGRQIKINDLSSVNASSVYVNPVEQIIYIQNGEQIEQGNIIHVNGEITVQDFDLKLLPFKFKQGDAFALRVKAKGVIANEYTYEHGTIFENTFNIKKELATGFDHIYDIEYVDTTNNDKSLKQWSCAIGENIALGKLCDGNFDCRYGDDESYCEIRYQPDKFYSSLPV